MSGRYRYTIENASYKLTDHADPPRIGLEALRALARWMGSRDERRTVNSRISDATVGSAAGGHSTAGQDGAAPDPQRDQGEL